MQLVDGGDCDFVFQQVDKVTKQMLLEAQLADAKLTKAKMEMAAEKEVLLKEKQQLLMVTDMFVICWFLVHSCVYVFFLFFFFYLFIYSGL
jgi:hypothetical protein